MCSPQKWDGGLELGMSVVSLFILRLCRFLIPLSLLPIHLPEPLLSLFPVSLQLYVSISSSILRSRRIKSARILIVFKDYFHVLYEEVEGQRKRSGAHGGMGVKMFFSNNSNEISNGNVNPF